MSVLLVAHGSRDPRFATTVTGIRDAVRRGRPDVRVELAYLDLNAPLVGDVLDDLAAADEPVTVVPLLLGDGYHSRFDLPVLLDAARRRHPALTVAQTPVLGSAGLVDALADRLREAGAGAEAGVLMYAVGSSDERSDDAARRRGAELADLAGVPVEVVFATKLGEDAVELDAALIRLRGAGARRIVGLPYFLSPGLLTERVERLLPDALVAQPLADHPAVISAIVDLAAQPLPPSILARSG